MAAPLDPAPAPRFDFGGRAIVVTGASSGLGAQFASALAASGARLVLAARREERVAAVAAGLGADCVAVRCDVTDAADRERLLDRALDAFGRLDGLVNNAGTGDIGPALRKDAAAFRHLLEVNLTAPYALACGAAERMRDCGGGAIVNIASVAGLTPISWQPHGGYVASKTGLVGLTRELASQWGRYGIRVNAIAPGPFTTELTGDAYEHGDAYERMVAAIPLRRIGRPGELDALLQLLLHPSGAYIDGQAIAVDGGLTAAL